MFHTTLVLSLFLISTVFSKIYFKDTFETDPFANNRWVHSNWKQDTGEASKFEWSGGLWSVDNRKGIRTPEDARFYAITSKFEEFDNSGKTLVLGLSVKHEQKIDCGGGYIKLLPPTTDAANFNGESPYSIMFGPDICGFSTKKVQAIFQHQGENLLKNEDVACSDDEFTHTYVLIVKPDNTYEIRIDGKSEASGNLKDDWNFEKPKKIKDPQAKKPSNWVDNEYIDDPTDVKPNDWEKEPEKIEDSDAKKPDDWDDEEDGTWEPPLIDNPNYKGEWKPKRIKNPEYNGAWVHPEIENPDHVEFKDVYKRGPLSYVGIEIWQVKAGSVFSDFIVADSVEEVDSFFKTRTVDKEKEEAAKAAYDEANKPPPTHDEHHDHDHDDEDDDSFKTDL